MKLIKATGGDIIQTPASGSRMQNIFNKKAQLYSKYGVITSESYLRLEYNTTGQTSVIPFTVLDTQSNKNATERRLKINDTFTVMSVAFFIGISPLGYDTPAKLAQMVLHTFPNKYVVTAAEAVRLQALYNGYIQLQIDSPTFWDSIPMYEFFRVGTSQEGVGATAAFNTIPRSEWTENMYGNVEQVPSVEFNGGSNFQMTIKLAASTDLSVTTNGATAVLYFGGFLHSGAQTVQRQVDAELRQNANMKRSNIPMRKR